MAAKKWKLERGKRYTLTLSLNMFESFAPNDLLEEKFLKNGFTLVEVFGKGKTRTVHGVWPHDDTEFSDKHVKLVAS